MMAPPRPASRSRTQRHRLSAPFMVLLFLALATSSTVANAQLSDSYYDASCPAALLTIRTVVSAAVLLDPRMGASLLRLHFHDCFVQAIKLSLVNSPSPPATSRSSGRRRSRLIGMHVSCRAATRRCFLTTLAASPARRAPGRTPGRCAGSRWSTTPRRCWRRCARRPSRAPTSSPSPPATPSSSSGARHGRSSWGGGTPPRRARRWPTATSPRRPPPSPLSSPLSPTRDSPPPTWLSSRVQYTYA
ncbi:Os11g0334938 [Oryza sativa Japonica Group]|uniref:Os11g0334938 protein n=1 Tax=Oryza sativa subsp. japonica TaxID=39947 RepID=A0A0N7KST9_ORYSJ|nr:Os11g0334938 [Oryza sativa Japonica Group]